MTQEQLGTMFGLLRKSAKDYFDVRKATELGGAIKYSPYSISNLETRFSLRRIDSNRISKAVDSVKLIAKVRNERHRLDFFLEHYRKMGVAQFHFVDNDSSDGTAEFLVSQPDCRVYSTKAPLWKHPYWIRRVLLEWCQGSWTIVVDADEFIVFPMFESVSLTRLTRFLDATGSSALRCVLLDMYANEAISRVSFEGMQPPWDVCAYFDQPSDEGLSKVRERVFGIQPCLTKVPLFKYTNHLAISSGMHRITGAKFSENLTGALLHFKFDAIFLNKIVEESTRKQYWQDAIEYRKYQQRLLSSDSNIYCEKSIRFQGSQQLQDLGVIHSSQSYTDAISHISDAVN